MQRNKYTEPVLTAAACALVGILAARGMFNSMLNFPLVFGLVCLGFGLLSVWRQRSLGSVAARATILLTGTAIAVSGWMYQQSVIDDRLAERRTQVLDVIRGETVPGLVGLEPLNTDQAKWDEAASLNAKATIVTFWARWCSPCVKEMPELEELYRRHRQDGLEILAVTRYDRPEDAEERRSDFSKAQKFVERRELTYPIAITDREDLYSAYKVLSIPATALVDNEGRIVDFAFGLDGSRSLMRRAVAMLNQTAVEASAG